MAVIKDLTFEIIQKCPNECLFCSSVANYNREQMIQLEDFKRVVDYLINSYGIEEISFSGGEPFLHPDLYNMILHCKTLGIRTVIFTSGVRRNIKLNEFEMAFLEKQVEDYYGGYKNFDEKVYHKVIKREKELYRRANEREFNSIYREEMKYLKDVGLDKIVFDLQAVSSTVYSTLMGREHRDLVLTSLMRAHAVGLETDVHFVPMKDNYKEFAELIEYLNICQTDNLSILNFVPQGRGEINSDRLMLDTTEWEEFREIYEQTKNLFNGKIRVGIPLLVEDRHKCTAGFSKIVIKYDGTVLPCPAFKEYDVSLLSKYGVKVYNIYEDLDKIKLYDGSRKSPLCKKLYKFTNEIK